MYRRLFTGMVDRGKTSEFIDAVQESVTHQTERGIRARTTIWGNLTGPTNGILITSDFNTLEELEKFTDLAVEDARFAVVRRAVRSLMVFESAEVAIQRLAYHSAGLISSEDVTAPHRYMRALSGEILPGRHRDFVLSISHALEYQEKKGINATTAVWTAVTGGTSGVEIIGEFDSLSELERFDDMAAQDAEFARLRRLTRESMVFLTSSVNLYRNLGWES